MRTSYIYILVGLLSFVLYTNTLTHGFVWDDQLVITGNSVTTKGFSGLFEVWTTNKYIEQRPTYRPIPQTIHTILWQFFPNEPMVGHLTVTLAYVICVLSFLFVLKHFFPKLNNWLVLFIGAMFSLMPVHSEVVANIKSLDEILSTIFVVWSIYYASKKGFKFILISSLFFITALLSKVSAVTVLPVFLFFIFNNTKEERKKLVLFLEPYVDVLELIVVVIFLSVIYQEHFFFYPIGSLITLIYGFKININFSPLTLIKLFVFVVFAYLFNVGTDSTIFLALYWFYKLNNKKVTFFNYHLLLIILTLLASVYDDISQFFVIGLFPIMLIFINFLLKKNKIPLWSKICGFLIIPLVLFLNIYTSIIDLETFLDIFIGLSTGLAPFIFYLIVKSKKPRLLLFILLLFTLVPLIKNYDNTNILNIQNNKYFINIPGEVLYDDLADRVLVNQPYHNVLIAAENNYQKTATICRIQLIYLQKLIFPIHLIHQHGTRQIEFASWKDWDVYLSIIIHLLLLGGIYYFFKKKKYLISSGITWYFLTMSIYTNIVVTMPDTMAERFLFLPSMGFAAAFIGGLYYFLNKLIKSDNTKFLLMAILLLPLFIYYGYKTIDRNKDWESNYTLAVNTLPFAQNNATINAQYALELGNLIENNLIKNKDSAQVIILKHYQKAIDIFPDFYGPQYDMAVYYMLQAEPDKAYPYMLEATRINPYEWMLQYYLGLIFYERKKYNEAIERFNIVQKNKYITKDPLANPELLETFEFEARCLHNIGKDSLAYIELEKGIELYNQASTYVLLANMYRKTGKTNKAIEVFERLLIQNPNDQELINTIQYLKEGKIY